MDVIAARHPLRRRTVFLLASVGVLATLPVWMSRFPPMVDLPQHAAQVALFRELHDPGFRFAHMFEVHWFTPYLVGYALLYGLTPLVGIVTASKLVVSAAIAAMPPATGLVLDELGGDPFWAVLVTPGLLGCVYYWGFLNFLVAAPLGILFLWMWMRRLRDPGPGTAAGVAVLFNLLFFCHALTCAFFGTIAVGWLLLQTRSLRDAVRAGFPLVTVLPLMAQWMADAKSHPYTTQVWWDLDWRTLADPHSMDGRLLGFSPRVFGLPRDAFSPGVLLLLVAIVAAAWLAGARPRWELRSWVPLIVCLLTLLLVPLVVFGVAVVYPRFATFVLPFAAMALATKPGPAVRYRAALLALLAAWTGLVAGRTLQFAAEARGFSQMVEQMEPGERALGLILNRNSAVAPAPVFLHFPAWYAATKGGVVDVSFALFPVEPVQYRYDIVPRAGIAFGWMPEHFRWRNFKGERYRYFMLRAQHDPSAMFAAADCPVRLAYHANQWWLFDAPAECYAPATAPAAP